MKRPSWIGRASHMKDKALDLAPCSELFYQGEGGSKPERAIYLLDQALAKAGIDYFAQASDFSYGPSFTVHVQRRDAERARAAIEKIQRKYA